jgi:hypothetical protein
MKTIVALALLLASPVVFASGLDGTWDVNTNNSSFGQLVFSDGGTTGVFLVEGYEDELTAIQTTPAGVRYSTVEVTFVRNGTYYQLYRGVISSDGCLLTGHLMNLSGPMQVPDRFPFTATKRNCT